MWRTVGKGDKREEAVELIVDPLLAVARTYCIDSNIKGKLQEKTS